MPLASSSGSSEPTVTEVVPMESADGINEPQTQHDQQMCMDINAQEFAGGMMKIVPSDVDVRVFVPINTFFLYILL